ncbi:MAG: DUF262 domain-containing protein, partial [Myxococcota bacterium]
MVKPTKKKTDVKQEVLFLGRLLEGLLEGKIRIPHFQRPFVWRQSDMLRLLDSVVLGYPIGSILLFDTGTKVSSHDRVGPITIGANPRGTISYLLDGQQRLSTLAGCLLFDPSRHEPRWENVDWDLLYDLEIGEFVTYPQEGPGPEHFPVNCLLSTPKFIEATRQIERQSKSAERARNLLSAADDLANMFRNYQIPVITVHETEVDVAVEVVTRLNRRGRRMSPDHVISALTYREGEFHLARKLDELQEEFMERGFGGLDRVFMLRTVLAAQGRDIYAKDWENLMVDDEVRGRLPESFEAAAGGMHAALDFLHDIGVTSDRLLPYGLQFVLLAEALRLSPSPSRDVRMLLQQWFWVTSFTAWFGGVSTSQARRALEEIRELVRGERTSLEVVNLTMPAQPFPSRFDARSARVRAFMLYLASLGPRSILSDSRHALEPGGLLTALGPRALRRIIANLGDLELSSSPANRMFADRRHRGQTLRQLLHAADIGAETPLFVSNNMSDASKALLASHGISVDAAQLIVSGDRVGFIKTRLETLIEGE